MEMLLTERLIALLSAIGLYGVRAIYPWRTGANVGVLLFVAARLASRMDLVLALR